MAQVFSGQSHRVTEFDLDLIKALGKPAPDEARWTGKVRSLFYPCRDDVGTAKIPVQGEWFSNDYIYRKYVTSPIDRPIYPSIHPYVHIFIYSEWGLTYGPQTPTSGGDGAGWT